MKRLLAIFLSLTMLVSAAPLSALAASDNSLSQTITVQSQPDADLVQAIASDPFLTRVDSAPVQEQNATVDTSNVSMEATNSFGKLLLDGMDLDGENGSNFSSGNRVIGITMNGSTATVKYVAEEDADLVVGIYTDDSEEQMVASGTVAAQKTLENTGYSTVDIEVTGSIPAYYVVKAYLLDKTEHAPLSNAYTDRSATKVIVDLESATINDFPEEQVVNLDDKSTTNFIVVNDNVTLLKADEVTVGKNQVVEIDNENLTYVIGNATEKIKSLQIGDVLTYEYEPGYFLIARVADISVDGDMVTIHGDNTLEEGDVFEAIKIETDASGDDFVCDDSALDEGVQYAGLEAMDEDDTETLEETNDIKNRIGHKFELLGEKSPVNGTVKIAIGATAKYTYANGQKNISVTFDSEVDVTLAIKGKIDGKLFSVPLGFAPFPGCYVGFEPTVKVKFEATGSIGAKMTSADGFEYKTFEGFQRINEVPVIKPKDFKIEATLFIGIDFKPKVAFLEVQVDDEEHALVGVEMNAEIGIEFKGTIYEKEKTDDVLHTCTFCIPIKISFKAKLGVKIGTFWIFSKSTTFNEWTIDLGEAYYSDDHSEFGWGECPYKLYKVKVSLEKCTEPDILIQERTVDGKLADIGKTGADGTLETYLQPGSYMFVAATQTLRYSKTFTVGKTASKVELKCIGTVDSGTTEPDIPTGGTVIASGTCGKEGDNLKWTLDSNGVLTVSGEGDMYNYNRDYDIAPWRGDGGDKVKRIVIEPGVTSVGKNTFCLLDNLKETILPEGIVTIGYGAFYWSDNLAKVNIPTTVTTIEDGAFNRCSIENIEIPEGITEIGYAVFGKCSKLKNIKVPSTVIRIDDYAFHLCSSLESIELPVNLASIGYATFEDCPNLKEVIYNGTKEQWNQISIESCNEQLNVATIRCTDEIVSSIEENSITTGKTTTDNTTLHAVFNGLTAGEDYAVIVSKSAENPLDAANLIYINQKTAGANGVLDVPFTSSESGATYVVACRKGGSTNPGGNTGKDDSSTSKPGGDKSDTTKPSTPEKPANSDGGGAIVAVVLIGGAAAAVTAGVILMMPVEVSGVAQLGDGNVLANANVQLMKDGQQVAQTTTDESGHFALEVKRGEYELRVTTVNPETGEQTVRTASVKAPAKNTNFVF